MPASNKLPLRVLFCLRGETTNQLEWHICTWICRGAQCKPCMSKGVVKEVLKHPDLVLQRNQRHTDCGLRNEEVVYGNQTLAQTF